MSNKRYLVYHGYGMGGLWWWVWAPSGAAILEAVAEVEVIVDQETIDRVVADDPDLEEVDLAALPPGALSTLRDQRTSQRLRPEYGLLVGRTPFHTRVTKGDFAVLSEIGVSGQRGRIVRQWPNGRSERIESWPMESTFDVRDPDHLDHLVPAEDFESAWAIAGSADEPRSVQDLIDGMATGRRYRYVFFWGHTPRRPGQVDGSCFSQWYPAEFTVDGSTYRTAEHWMMAAKARLFGAEQIVAKILAARHPGEAKALGRAVADFDETVWHRERFALVVEGNVHKFTQNPALGNYLAGTTERVLVEASPLDHLWGTGLPANDPRSEEPHQWPGQNLLGFALMATREQLPRA